MENATAHHLHHQKSFDAIFKIQFKILHTHKEDILKLLVMQGSASLNVSNSGALVCIVLCKSPLRYCLPNSMQNILMTSVLFAVVFLSVLTSLFHFIFSFFWSSHGQRMSDCVFCFCKLKSRFKCFVQIYDQQLR